jgi:hypothetical protein
MSHKFTLVRFTHKGCTIAINPARVNYAEEARENRNFTYIRFSGGDGDYAYVDMPVEDVIAKLTASESVATSGASGEQERPLN